MSVTLAGHIFQANVNHSASVQDLLTQMMDEWKIVLAAIAEPYRVPPDCIGNMLSSDAITRKISAYIRLLKAFTTSTYLSSLHTFSFLVLGNFNGKAQHGTNKNQIRVAGQ